MKLLRFRFCCAVVLTLLVALAADAARGQVTYELRAGTFADLPGVAGYGFADFNIPVINESGDVAFLGSGNVAGERHINGVWAIVDGEVRLVAARDQQAPGCDAGVSFRDFAHYHTVISDGGQVAFTAKVTGDGVDASNEYGIWAEINGELQLIARRGAPAPGCGEGVFFVIDAFDGPQINAAGQVVVGLELVGENVEQRRNDYGIWLYDGGELKKVMRTGEPVAGLGEGVYLRQGQYPALNNAGVVSYHVWLDGGEVRPPFAHAIRTFANDRTTMLYQGGAQAAGVAEGLVHSSIGVTTMNTSGQVGFLGRLSGAGADNSNNRGLWVLDSDGRSQRLVARKGMQAPGCDAGVVFDTLGTSAINNAGALAFSAEVTGPGVEDDVNAWGIWAQIDGALQCVARMGEHAPGTPQGVTFHRVGLGSNVGPQFNTRGQVVVPAELTGPDITNANNAGIWMTDPAGTLHKIVRAGDRFDIDGDPATPETQTVSHVRIVTFASRGDDGRPDVLNEAGQLVLCLEFLGRRDMGVYVFEVQPTE